MPTARFAHTDTDTDADTDTHTHTNHCTHAHAWGIGQQHTGTQHTGARPDPRYDRSRKAWGAGGGSLGPRGSRRRTRGLPSSSRSAATHHCPRSVDNISNTACTSHHTAQHSTAQHTARALSRPAATRTSSCLEPVPARAQVPTTDTDGTTATATTTTATATTAKPALRPQILQPRLHLALFRLKLAQLLPQRRHFFVGHDARHDSKDATGAKPWPISHPQLFPFWVCCRHHSVVWRTLSRARKKWWPPRVVLRIGAEDNIHVCVFIFCPVC